MKINEMEIEDSPAPSIHRPDTVKKADRYYIYAVVDITEGLEVLGRKTLLYCLKGHPKTGEPLPVFRSEEDATEFLRVVGISKAVIVRLEVAY